MLSLWEPLHIQETKTLRKPMCTTIALMIEFGAHSPAQTTEKSTRLYINMYRYEYINLPTRNAVSFEPTTNTSHFHRVICHPLVLLKHL